MLFAVTRIGFLGLELDTNEMMVRISKVKIEEVISKIEEVLLKKKVNLKAMQSLTGVLNSRSFIVIIKDLIGNRCFTFMGYHDMYHE